jgi:hypothetical protein
MKAPSHHYEASFDLRRRTCPVACHGATRVERPCAPERPRLVPVQPLLTAAMHSLDDKGITAQRFPMSG